MDTRHTTREYIQTIKDAINVGSVCSRMKLRKGMLNASDSDGWMGNGSTILFDGTISTQC